MQIMNPKKTPQFNSKDACNSFAACLDAMLKAEKKPAFTYTAINKPIIKQLVHYFCGQEDCGLDLLKGIFLRGPVGTGKSVIMRAFAIWLSPGNRFRIVDCRDLQKQALKDGFDSLLKYSVHSYNYKNGFYHRDNGGIIYCFDDLGGEKVTKFYGNDINVMAEIILDRYREFDITRLKTHITSNLKDGDLIEEMYSLRVRDRMREMFNFVDLKGPSFRR